MADPKKAQVRNQKALGGDYTQMKILEILLELSLRPLRMLVKLFQKLNESTSPLQEKYRFSQVGEQRAKVMGKSQVASIFKKGKDAIRKTKKV